VVRDVPAEYASARPIAGQQIDYELRGAQGAAPVPESPSDRPNLISDRLAGFEGTARDPGAPLRIGVDFPRVKRCEGCAQTKPRSAFRKSAQRLDGLRRKCRSCEAPPFWYLGRPDASRLRLCPACRVLRFAEPERLCRSCAEGPQRQCTSCKKTQPAAAFPARNFQGIWRCRSCQSKADSRRYDRAIQERRCPKHKDRAAVPGRTSCAQCLERDRLKSAARRAAKA
jgi:hypothetical protein